MSSDLARKPARMDLDRRLSQGLHGSAMVVKPAWWVRVFLRPFFNPVRFDRRFQDTIRHAAEQGTVIYVLQNKSLLDYLYFNLAFLAHGLPLARFANGIRTYLVRPLLKSLRLIF